jgi:hypothetical protein
MDIKKSIHNVITNIDQIPISEDDLKFKLAWGLKKLNPSMNVSIEYPFKKSLLEAYDIGNNKLLYFDLMVENKNNFIPIEIKYKTKHLKLLRNILGSEDDLELKNQSAQNLAKYGFWKDVYRIQSLKNQFKSVNKGYQIFLTNDASYTRPSRENSEVINFDISEGRNVSNGAQLLWSTKDGRRIEDVSHAEYQRKTFYNKKGFIIKNNYVLKWDKVKIQGFDFYILIVEV